MPSRPSPTIPLLDRVLAPGGIRPRFQGIASLVDGAAESFCGIECLSQGPKDTNLADAEVLFAYARSKNAEVVIDRHCIECALAHLGNASRIAEQTVLHFNVHLATLTRDPSFARFLLDRLWELEVPPSRVVVELLEFGCRSARGASHANLELLRGAGVRLALDDFGSRESGLRMLIDLPTHYLKIDRYFVEDLHRDPARRVLLSSMVDLARRLDKEIIAEGVETSEQLYLLAELGIDRVQGYLLSLPTEDPTQIGAARGALHGCFEGRRPA
jgi:EAL domain-containing protein (putative c-di-GMP-specific phosphodiesterase class I)